MRACLSCLVLGMLVACGSDKPPITQTEFCKKYAQDVCSAVAPACLITSSACLAGRLDECAAQAQAQANVGRDFIPSNGDACLAKVGEAYGKLNQGAVALPAAALTSMNTACANVYRGSIALLGPCAVDVDCLDGMICDKGKCGHTKTVAQGQGCANIGELCPQGSYCGTDANGILSCLGKGNLGTVCSDALPCLESLRCAAGVCSVRLGVGLDCSVDGDCDSGLFCEPYAKKCATDIRFANGSAACAAMGG